MNEFMSMKEFAEQLKVPAWKIQFALVSGRLPEPQRLMNRRMFTDADIEIARNYFAIPVKPGRQKTKEAHE